MRRSDQLAVLQWYGKISGRVGKGCPPNGSEIRSLREPNGSITTWSERSLQRTVATEFWVLLHE